VANLTLTIDETVLRRARIRALEQRTSVNAVVREFLEAYAGGDERVAAVAMFLDLAEQSHAGDRGEGRTWTREDIYAERTAG
jgi:plasmid stability protein